jgi:hypothetical protein
MAAQRRRGGHDRGHGAVADPHCPGRATRGAPAAVARDLTVQPAGDLVVLVARIGSLLVFGGLASLRFPSLAHLPVIIRIGRGR